MSQEFFGVYAEEFSIVMQKTACLSCRRERVKLTSLKRLQPSASAVGDYAAAGTFARTPFFLLSAFYAVLLPLVASAHAADNSKLVRDYISQAIRCLLLIRAR